MVCFAKRAALALAVVSVSSAAFGQVLTLGGTSTFGAPYAKMGAWDTYLKYNSAAGVLPAVSATNVAGNGTQAVFSNQYLGWDGGMPFNGGNGATHISATVPVTGYAAGAYQNTNVFYLKSTVLEDATKWGTSSDANGHMQFDFRLGFIQDGAGFVTAGNLPSTGKNMDPDSNTGTKGIYLHYNLGNLGATVLGQPGNNWSSGNVSDLDYMSVGQINRAASFSITRTSINGGPSVDLGVKYDSAMEVSGKMFADPVNAGMVIAQVKMGTQIDQFSFDPTDARFGGTFDWQNAKPVIYTGPAGWTNPINKGTVGIMSSGDANTDGNVDLIDLTILAGNWNTGDKTFSAGDFSQDGLVNLVDLTILAGQWNSTVNGMSFEQAIQSMPALAGAVVPEPTSLGLITLGAAALLRRRRA